MIFEISALLWTIFLLRISKCSIVMDFADQKQAIFVSDYCPKMEYCAEGAHVMCMYYNPDSLMGPRCSQPRNVTINHELALKLLEVSNAIRSKVALGKERGKGGLFLPRAYGMFKLKWDEELATFAQVLANQCVLRHDLCRATKRFPDPGQTAGLVRFTYPDWFPVSHNAQFTKPGLGMSKLHYAITQSLKSWYSQKDHVTADMIMSYPDWSLAPDKLGGRLYLEMIVGDATHMGCGMSAYTEYAYHNNKADLNYNSVQVICNFSSRARKGQAVYNTKPSSQVGHTIRCGCPDGFEEDADCLCSESPNKQTARTFKKCDKVNCQPAVVLLPIFTVQDAPPNKLIGRQGPEELDLRFDNSSARIDNTLDIFKNFNPPDNNLDVTVLPSLQIELDNPLGQGALSYTPRPENNVIQENVVKQFHYRQSQPLTDDQSYNALDGPIKSKSSNEGSTQSPLSTRTQTSVVKKRYFGRTTKTQEQQRQHKRSQAQKNDPESYNKYMHQLKQSIFSKVNKFELPGKMKSPGQIPLNTIRKDVAPRKDFSNAQKLLNSYLNKKKFVKDATGKKKKETTEGTLKKLKRKSVNFNKYLKNKFHYQDFNVSTDDETVKRFDIKNTSEESDKKLMTLLDTLEQEVKHIELDMNEKEIFDAKIRKIYGTVVGKTVDLLNRNHNKKLPCGNLCMKKNMKNMFMNRKRLFLDDIEDSSKDTMDEKMYETEDRVKEFHFKMKNNRDSTYPNARRQTAISEVDDKGNKELAYCEKAKSHTCSKPTPPHRATLDDKNYKSDDYLEHDDNKNSNNDLRNTVMLRSFGDGKRNLRRVRFGHELKARPVYTNGIYGGRIKDKHNKVKPKYNDVLGLDRRKYYQEKIDTLEKKFQIHRRNRNELERQVSEIRLLRPTNQDIRHSKLMVKHQNSVYIPDRARSVHTL